MGTLKKFFGFEEMQKIAHKCDDLLESGAVSTNYKWGGTSNGGGMKVWENFIRNFLDAYRVKYAADYHEMVAVATLLSLADVRGVIRNAYMMGDFSTNLNRFCQMGKAGNYKYVPLVRIGEDETIKKALKKPDFKKNFAVVVRCCEKKDGDPRNVGEEYIRTKIIRFRI